MGAPAKWGKDCAGEVLLDEWVSRERVLVIIYSMAVAPLKLERRSTCYSETAIESQHVNIKSERQNVSRRWAKTSEQR